MTKDKKIEQKSSEDIDEHFKPVLARDIELRFFKSDERGDFFLARNPRTRRYIKVHESAKTLMDNLDGTKTMEELEQLTSINLKKFINVLARGGFLANIKAEKKEEPFYTVKIPIFKSNKSIFIKMYRFFSFVASKPFKIFYAFFVGFATLLFLMHFSEAFHYTVMNFDLTVPLRSVLLLIAISYVVELAHEFAHTGASYNHGAEPGDVGVVFHFLVLFFYVETPDTRMLSTKGNIDTFLAGPLTSIFAAAICTYVFVFTDYYPLVWGASAFLWYLSALITLSPFMETDGYYTVEHLLEFPNLFSHAVSYLRLSLFRFLNRISKEDYYKTLKGYTQQELKVMKLFAVFIPIQVGILVYFFFFMGIKVNMFHVLEIAPVILSGDHLYGIKAYFLLFLYTSGLIVGAFAAVMTAYRFFTKERW